MSSILIRADASRAIGTGHVRRCIALADALRGIGVEAQFVTRPLGLDSARMVEKAGYRVALLSAPDGEPVAGTTPHAAWAEVPQDRDARETIAAVSGPVIAVLVDHYAFDADWHHAVGQALGVPVAAIDDLADRAMAVALLIDHNFSADPKAKHAATAGDARLLAGPRYALIDAAYAQAPRYVFSEEVRSIGIFLGGADSAGLSLPVARALRDAGFAGPIGIATTSANPQAGAIRAADWLGTPPTIDAPDLAAFFAAHDLQIGAAGGATWERCCIGAPTLAICVADNQRAVIEPLRDLGVIAVHDGVDPAGIARDALALDPAQRRTLSEAACKLVDGKGAERAAIALASLATTVRPATLADAELTHRWRDYPATRAVSRQSDPIPFEDHRRWLQATLANPDRALFIALAGTRPIGVVRFDRLPGETIEVSIYLDPELHGLGLGLPVLLAAEAAIARRLSRPHTLHAETLPENHASQRLFARAGYAFTGEAFRKTSIPEGQGPHAEHW